MSSWTGKASVKELELVAWAYALNHGEPRSYRMNEAGEPVYSPILRQDSGIPGLAHPRLREEGGS